MGATQTGIECLFSEIPGYVAKIDDSIEQNPGYGLNNKGIWRTGERIALIRRHW